MKLTFNTISKDHAVILKGNGVTNEDLFQQASDLYVGCKSLEQAGAIIKDFNSPSIASSFKPQKGSDMEKYPIAVDIAFGCTVLYFKQQKNFATDYYFISDGKKIPVMNTVLKKGVFGSKASNNPEPGKLWVQHPFGTALFPVYDKDDKLVVLPEYEGLVVGETDWDY